MQQSCIQLDDLPNEIILIIFKNLNNFDVLYAFIGLNTRFNTIINDTIFRKELTLTSFNGSLDQFATTKFDRFCVEILPKINDKIKWLNVESATMERILLSTYYPNLYALGLYDLDPETAGKLFCGKIRFFFTLSLINSIRQIYLKIYLI
jgi:hypothetical protein